MIRCLLLTLCAVTLSACSTFGYYVDLMTGHSELLEQQKPIAELIANKETSPKLRRLLQTSQNIRDFASKVLYLPENNSYRMYADLKRPYAVWNVVATKEFSVLAKKWCFLIVGCLSYRGYFSKEEAVNFANKLKGEGYDIYVAGANAYSTLGWFDDPLLNTMLYKSETRRAGIIFHELAHQVLYIDNDSAFNEAFATVVEKEGIRRWMVQKGQQDKYDDYILDKKLDYEFTKLLQAAREKLKQLYSKVLPDQEKRKAKTNIFSLLQKEYIVLKKTWGNIKTYDKWMEQELNNSHLLLIATYHELVPLFQKLLKKENNNLEQFYGAVKILGKLDKEKRELFFHRLDSKLK